MKIFNSDTKILHFLILYWLILRKMKIEKLKTIKFLPKLQNFPFKILFDAFKIKNVFFLLIMVLNICYFELQKGTIFF